MTVPWLAPPPTLGGLEEVQLSSANTALSFAVRWLGALKVRGTFTELSGRVCVPREGIERATARVEIAAASIHTGIGLRDRHLREPRFLDARRFPSIVFHSEGARWRGTHLFMPGTLVLRGIERPCDLVCTFDGAEALGLAGLRANIATTVRRTDFGVASPVGRRGADPRFLIIGDEVRIAVVVRAAPAR
jgi:polyisoprenoid-binding protein YceI